MYRNLMLLKTFQIEKNVLIHKEREITKQYNNINWKRNFEGQDLACKKTQKGHTTENSGKKFHIQKNPVLTKLLLIDDDTIRTSEWKNGVEKNSSRRCYHLAK